MIDLAHAIDDYLTLRRSLGHKLEEDGRLLPSFVAYIERSDSPVITVPLALAWAGRPPATAKSRARRLGIVRRFARYVRALDPRTEVPSPGLVPYCKARLAPYLYSSEDVRALMEATAHDLHGPLKAFTYATLFGLLAATGIRVGEAIALDRPDVDLVDGLLFVRTGKFGKSREVPLHPTTTAALRAYARRRDRVYRRCRSPSFFVSQTTTRLIYKNIEVGFRRLVRRGGLTQGRRRPRIHDLRHTFAIRTLLDWYRAGVDVEARIPLLSTYLGHVNPSSTYWYLTAAPELMGLAAKRLERALGVLP